MRLYLTALAALIFLLPTPGLKAAPSGGSPTLSVGEWRPGHSDDIALFGKRKKKFLAIGVVVGEPIGFGGRVLFQPSRFGIAADITYDRLRLDTGPLIGVLGMKVDARYYAKGLLGKLLRLYSFGGVTLWRGEFEEGGQQSALAIDAGVGGGIRLGRISLNAEAGLLVPAKSTETFQPRFDLFSNVAVLFWIGQMEVKKKKKKREGGLFGGGGD